MGIMYMKDSVWKYEKEYRIVTRNHRAIEKEMFDTYKKKRGVYIIQVSLIWNYQVYFWE